MMTFMTKCTVTFGRFAPLQMTVETRIFNLVLMRSLGQDVVIDTFKMVLAFSFDVCVIRTRRLVCTLGWFLGVDCLLEGYLLEPVSAGKDRGFELAWPVRIALSVELLGRRSRDGR